MRPSRAEQADLDRFLGGSAVSIRSYAMRPSRAQPKVSPRTGGQRRSGFNSLVCDEALARSRSYARVLGARSGFNSLVCDEALASARVVVFVRCGARRFNSLVCDEALASSLVFGAGVVFFFVSIRSYAMRPSRVPPVRGSDRPLLVSIRSYAMRPSRARSPATHPPTGPPTVSIRSYAMRPSRAPQPQRRRARGSSEVSIRSYAMRPSRGVGRSTVMTWQFQFARMR